MMMKISNQREVASIGCNRQEQTFFSNAPSSFESFL